MMASEIPGLAEIRTVADMTEAFRDEERCRRLLEAMVWPEGRICPGCGCRRSIALAGRELGRRARPGLYQCPVPELQEYSSTANGRGISIWAAYQALSQIEAHYGKYHTETILNN